MVLEAAGIRLLQGLFYPLPLRAASRLGSALGWFLFSVARMERRSTLASLEMAFGPELSPRECRRLAARCYRHFGGVIAEFLCQAHLGGRPLDDLIVLENPEVLEAALAQGKGVLLATGHQGNWELMGAAVAAHGLPFSAYVGRQHNPIADGFVNGLRRRVGIETVTKQAAMRGMLRALQAGRVLTILSDQHFSRNRYFVRFFGRPVSIAPGLASLMLHTGAPAMFAETWRVGRFRYRTRFAPLPAPAPSGNEELDLLRIGQRFFDTLEAAVRRHPEQYFWMHKRWRPPPPPERLSPTNRAFLEGRAAPGDPPTPEPRADAAS
jgi:Kdo2-lipid IVA lauroyltransferase/acyltransferase